MTLGINEYMNSMNGNKCMDEIYNMHETLFWHGLILPHGCNSWYRPILQCEFELTFIDECDHYTCSWI